MYADVLYESHFSNNSVLHRHFGNHRVHLSNDADFFECPVSTMSLKNTISLLPIVIFQTSNSVKLC